MIVANTKRIQQTRNQFVAVSGSCAEKGETIQVILVRNVFPPTCLAEILLLHARIGTVPTTKWHFRSNGFHC